MESAETEYERLYAWRARWQRLASKREPGRLQARQERIERRAATCNAAIGKLLRSWAARSARAQAECTKVCDDLERISREANGLSIRDRSTLAHAARIVRIAAANTAKPLG